MHFNLNSLYPTPHLPSKPPPELLERAEIYYFGNTASPTLSYLALGPTEIFKLACCPPALGAQLTNYVPVRAHSDIH